VSWDPWTECSMPCGRNSDGIQLEFGRVVAKATLGGAPCPSPLVNVRRCTPICPEAAPPAPAPARRLRAYSDRNA
jgi:hypothetical protein